MFIFQMFMLQGVVLVNFVYSYKVPEVKFEAYFNKGLTISIPDEGFSNVTFHGKLNKKINGLEAGHWNQDATKVTNRTWYIRDDMAQLKVGDKIYYWIYVIKEGIGYQQEPREWTVTGLLHEIAYLLPAEILKGQYNITTTKRKQSDNMA